MSASLTRRAIAIPAALATIGLAAAMTLSACQPRTPADTPRPLMSGRQEAP